MSDSLVHHAYYSIGSSGDTLPKLVSHIGKVWELKTRGNPDFRQESYVSLGVDEARALKEAAERTAVTGGKQIFVVAAESVTREAQNALLKIVEEPPAQTHFFFVFSTSQTLLPTLLSRLEFLSIEAFDCVDEEARLLACSFLGKRTSERLKLITSLLKEVGDMDSGKMKLFNFLDALERELSSDTTSNAQALSEILGAKKYSRDRAPSFKLLLEHLALVLPKNM